LDQARDKLPPDINMLLTLYAYVLCIEARYVYATIGNLLGALTDPNARPGLAFYDQSSAEKCFKQIRVLHDAAGGGFAIIKTWSQVLDFELRNTVGHLDFVLSGSGSGIMAVREMMRQITSTGRGRAMYHPQQIEEYYQGAHAFLKAFIASLRPFAT
jgi:hypothetical protein